jgi:hypothetical protein
MTMRKRIQALAAVARKFPELGIRRSGDLERLLVAELGSIDALDAWQQTDSGLMQAMAPREIYQICAGNLPVSSWMGITLGLLLGSRLTVKAARGDLASLQRFVRVLPPGLRRRVTLGETLDESAMHAAEVVVVFGRDETLRAVRAELNPGQRFIGYGQQVSALWVGDWTTQDLSGAGHDVVIYDQSGCLSPQVVYGPAKGDILSFARRLALAVAKECRKAKVSMHGMAESVLIQELRDVARVRGDQVFASKDSTDWTVIVSDRPEWEFSIGHRVVWVKHFKSASLAEIRGKISTVGIVGSLSTSAEKIWLEAGAKRFCPAGKMQHPPLTWHHDGRPALGDLVTWVDKEA